ncbi:hypothetical protein Bbelb_244430 [Branchiostoma belcheri]|nr:hypothetical protein Bbelb_244430 [Branchiostoma belcheri]
MSNIHIINTCKALSLIQSEQGHRQHLVSLRRDRTLYKEPGFPALERERRSFAVSASSSSVSARRLFQPARRLFQQARRLFQLVVCFSSSSVSARRLFQLARRLFQLVVCFSKLVVCFSSSKLVVCFSKLVVCFSKLVVCFSKLVVCVLARRLFQQARRLFQPARCLFKQARRLFKLVPLPGFGRPTVAHSGADRKSYNCNIPLASTRLREAAVAHSGVDRETYNCNIPLASTRLREAAVAHSGVDRETYNCNIPLASIRLREAEEMGQIEITCQGSWSTGDGESGDYRIEKRKTGTTTYEYTEQATWDRQGDYLQTHELSFPTPGDKHFITTISSLPTMAYLQVI